MTTISERIKEAMRLKGMRKADVAFKTGLSKSAISAYVSGQYEPKGAAIEKLAEVLHVSPEWLQGKDVPMNPAAPKITSDMLKFALFDGKDGITDEMLEEVKAFAQYVKEKNN